ncbi:MAG: ABC transporter substrate-binding protein [Chloroflexota bacterium]
MFKRVLILISLAGLAAFAVACSGDDDATATPKVTLPAGVTATPFPDSGPVTLHLGFFANVTHAEPLVGLNNGIFAQELGSNVTIDQKTFNAGPDEITALFAGDLDVAYIGPNPAVNGYVQSGGDDVRIVAGAASGGALLVVTPEITSAAQLSGKRIASPQLGNTQDVALRAWLKANNVPAVGNGGDVTVVPTANADALTAFKAGNLDGAWVPEPWATRLIQEGGGHALVDEKTLWPGGKFATTVLIVRNDFLKEHPDVVQKLVSANVKTVQWIQANPADAQTLVNQQIGAITSKPLADGVIAAAWKNLDFTYDPVASSVTQSTKNAHDVGLLQDEPDLANLFSLDILNGVLAKQGLPAVSQ